MKERVKWIDIAKGICILLVVFGHMVSWDDSIRYFIYSFHIPMFFILSGATMHLTHETKKEFPDFIKRNVDGLLKPYLFCSVFFILVDVIRGGTA